MSFATNMFRKIYGSLECLSGVESCDQRHDSSIFKAALEPHIYVGYCMHYNRRK